MLADISEARGAEQGVGDGVQHDVRVAVTGEAAAVRDGDAAEHHRALAAKGMVSFASLLKPEDAEAIRAYLVDQSKASAK